MKLKAIFENNSNKVYDIVTGSVFKEEYNETLDSATIHLTNIEMVDRLEDIQPYTFVYIFEEGGTFKKYFLIDSFVESILNLNDNIYDYMIECFSPLKYFEKIQLPNRVITHSLVSGQKTIREYLYEYCSLYVPKIKVTTNGSDYLYKYMFDFEDLMNPTSDIYKKFDIVCPDLSFSKATLRNVITALMEVVGCIPSINYRTLCYIDLKKESTPFNVMNGRIYDIKRSLSSDSCVNTLTSMATNVLDDNNLVVSENIGFRDKNNVFLKSQENLSLQTTYGIYNVAQMKMCAYVDRRFSIYNIATGQPYGQYEVAISDDRSKITITITNKTDLSAQTRTFTDMYLTYVVNDMVNDYKKIIAKQIHIEDTVVSLGLNQTKTIEIYNTEGITYNNVWAKMTCDGRFYFVSNYQGPLNNSSVYEADITPLCVENKKRQLLDTDFLKMQSVNSIDDLAKYYYATIGYDIGGKEINGFSQTYTSTNGFWDSTKTYIENIYNSMIKFDKYGDITTKEAISEFLGGIPIIETDSNHSIPGTFFLENKGFTQYGQFSTFALMFFKIKYKPMNDIHIKYTKDSIDIPFNIEQLDTQESGITNFDAMSKREQQKINRLGNDVLQIHQSQVESLNDIQPLNSSYKNSIVFSREIQVYDDFFEVNYVATKNYVLRNYFTGIQTKYRAYEYVDYNSTTLRKENIKVYALIDKFYIDGSNKIGFGKYNHEKSLFLTSVIPFSNNDLNLKYCVKTNATDKQFFKNEMSLINYDDGLIFSTNDYDNVSPGSYIKNSDDALGGVPQQWYIWENYDAQHKVKFTNNVDIVDKLPIFNNSGDKLLLFFELEKLYNVPAIYDNLTTNYVDIHLYDFENKTDNIKVYKDNSEVLNTSLQIEYYTTCEHIKWTSYFISSSKLEVENNEVEVHSSTSLNVSNESHTESIETLLSGDIVGIDNTNDELPYIYVNWNNVPSGVEYIRLSKKTLDKVVMVQGETLNITNPLSVVMNTQDKAIVVITGLDKTLGSVTINVSQKLYASIKDILWLDDTRLQFTIEPLKIGTTSVQLIQNFGILASKSFSLNIKSPYIVEHQYNDIIAFHKTTDLQDKYYISFNDTKTTKVYSINESNGLYSLNYKLINNDLTRKVEKTKN